MLNVCTFYCMQKFTLQRGNKAILLKNTSEFVTFSKNVGDFMDYFPNIFGYETQLLIKTYCTSVLKNML